MYPIMLYKIFSSSDDFAKWQSEERRHIQSIQQLPMSFGIDQEYLGNDKMETKAQIVMGVFVVYWDRDPSEKLTSKQDEK